MGDADDPMPGSHRNISSCVGSTETQQKTHGLQRMGTTDLRHEVLFNPEEAISVLTKSDVADLVALMSDEELREYLTESVHPPAKLH